MLLDVLQSILFALIISIDCFFATFGFGISKVKLPWLSIVIMALANLCLVAVSSTISYFVSSFINDQLFEYISFGLVFGVGVLLLSGEIINHFTKESEVKNPLLRLLSDSKLADKNKDKVLSPKESVILGFVLASDGFSIGLSVGQSYSVFFFPLFALLFSFIALSSGYFFGKRLSKTSNLNLSWLCGLFLVIIAITKIFI